MVLGPLAFLAPWLLIGLVALPVLWWLLRAVPPAPLRRLFPGVRLLLNLDEKERMPAQTPWWLLLLRIVALAAVVLAFAEPVLNPRAGRTEGPLLVLLDGGWGDAPDWPVRIDRISQALNDAVQDSRPVAVVSLADVPPAEGGLTFRAAHDWADRLAGLAPAAWSPDRAAWAEWFADRPESFSTLWLSDGLDRPGTAPLAEALLGRGPVSFVPPNRPARGLTPARLEAGALTVTAVRVPQPEAGTVALRAIGPDPNGVERVLGTGSAAFDAGADAVDVAIEMPVELRNRVSRIELADGRSAAGIVLADDAVRRRKVALMAAGAGSEAQDLIDPLNYLRKAMLPFAEIVEAPLLDMLQSAPDVLVLADVAGFTDGERQAVTDWVEAGGVLIRFAGPRLAQSGAGQLEVDPLLPVRLRAGGRSVGGAMSWGAPRRLSPFGEDGPFAGLVVPDDVDISAQVMAQPDPDLQQRVLAALEDGTPLITGKPLGQGRVVLFHVTASAGWSNLPLSGLFVQMLERLTQSAGGIVADSQDIGDAVWSPVQVLDGFGGLHLPSLIAGVPGGVLATERPSVLAPPGIYASGERRTVFNTLGAESRLAELGALPAGVAVEAMDQARERPLGPWLLALALVLLMVDVLVTLWVSGRLSRFARVAAAAVLAGVLASTGSDPAAAQSGADADADALYAANTTVLAYVETGSPRIDRVSAAGLKGLSRALFERTSIEPGDPVAIDLETDDLSLIPLLYWPVTDGQVTPSDAAYTRLNDYLRHGGMILFDTMDSDLGAGISGTTPNGRVLQRIGLRLDIPPLAQIPADHVLTRTFYLLQDFPGRWHSAPVWVEAPQDAQEVDGLPFRNLNDGVTPVVIGGNDWASAWAIQDNGQPMFPVGRGLGGERQREMAIRFGINLVMHVMTGNYKSDQVHVPALLDRLGQ